MIALAAMVLISAVLGGALRLGSRAWDRGEQQVEMQGRNRDVVWILSQELRSAYPYPAKDGEKLVNFFRGEGQSVRFVSALSDPSPGGRAPFRLVTFFFEPGRGLFVESAPILGGALPEENRGAARLLDSRVREFRLRYLGPDGWVSSWESKEMTTTEAGRRRLPGGQAGRPAAPDQGPAIPRAVEVTLTLPGLQGPILLPIFATTDLKKTNPAGSAGS